MGPGDERKAVWGRGSSALGANRSNNSPDNNILIVTLMFTAAILSAQNKTALVIGCGQCENDFSALTSPVPETRKMADTLESIGFEVIRAYSVQSQEQFYALLEMFVFETLSVLILKPLYAFQNNVSIISHG